MKNTPLLAFLLIAAFVVPIGIANLALADEPKPEAGPLVVQVLDTSHVFVNGRPVGSVVDAVTNAPECKAAVLDWINEREQRIVEAHAGRMKAAEARARAATERAARIEATLAEKLAAEIATGEGPKAKVLRSIVAEVEQPEKERRRVELAAEIEAKRRELEKLAK